MRSLSNDGINRHGRGGSLIFHNHGNPGPGLYLPKEWRFNRAQFEENGHMLDDLGLVRFLQPLPPEGFYRVAESFHCCEKQCRLFERDALLQLGYNADADPILFVPELVDSMFAIPAKGWSRYEMIGKMQGLQDTVTKRDTLPPGSPARNLSPEL